MASDTVDLKKEANEQKMRQIAGQLELEEFDEINDTHQGILTCQSYLREERPEELWDCESIISTYSTLDNHPSVIKVRTCPYVRTLFVQHLVRYLFKCSVHLAHAI